LRIRILLFYREQIVGAAISTQNVSKSFGNLKAVDDVSIDVEEKSVTILIGPNGSGKTTLINLISGFYKVDSGNIHFDGKEISKLPPHKIYKLGLARTFQIPSLFWKLNVLENLLVAGNGNPGETFSRSLFPRVWQDAEERTMWQAKVALDLVGLSKLWDKPALNLSGGQMKLLEIGRCLMSNAKVLLLDEPVSGVNPTLAHEIFDRIVKLRDDYGITFFIIEHRLDIAMRYIDDVVAMAYGKLVSAGKPDKVLSDPRVIEAYLGA
jgi:branched-chain amino acid transport system ATP-binding protein